MEGLLPTVLPCIVQAYIGLKINLNLYLIVFAWFSFTGYGSSELNTSLNRDRGKAVYKGMLDLDRKLFNNKKVSDIFF